MSLTSSAIQYWESGHKAVCVNPPPDTPLDQLKPYCVCIRNQHHVPVNVLVFAGTKCEAAGRVVVGLELAAKHDYRGPTGHKYEQLDSRTDKRCHFFGPPNRAYWILKSLRDKKLELFVEEIDTLKITSMAWASNDRIT